MSALFGVWFGARPAEAAQVRTRLADLLGVEFVDHGAPETLTAVGEGVSYDLIDQTGLPDDRDLPLSRFPLELQVRPHAGTGDSAHALDLARQVFDAARGWGWDLLLIRDAQRLLDRWTAPTRPRTGTTTTDPQ